MPLSTNVNVLEPARTRIELGIQLVSDKSRASLIDKTFSKWWCDKQTSIFVMLKFRQNISFRFVTIGDLTPKEKFSISFVYSRNFPNIKQIVRLH